MATLGELLQAKGDADYAGGGEGGAISPDLYSSAAANEYLQHAADLTYNAHRYLAEQHDRNMQQELQGLNGVDFKDLLPQDQQALMPEYGGVTQDIANNFGVVRNPMSNPQAWAALKNSESSIRQRLSQAQSDAAFINKQNEFVQLHPEFNTPDFQQKKAQFLATPVGQRQPFVVTPPLTYNPATAYKTIAELAKKKYAHAGTNGKYITQEEGETIDPDQYAKLAQQLPGTDQYGNSIEAARRASYDKLPPNLRPATYQDFVNQEAQLYKPQDQVNKADIKTDEYGTINANYRKQLALQKDRQAFEAQQSAEDNDVKLQIAGLRTKDGAFDPNATGAFINKTFHDIATSTATDEGLNDKLNAINTNRNIGPTQKIKMMNDLMNDPANYTNQAVPNALLQPTYGDNSPLKHTQKSADNTNKADGITSSNESQATIPTEQVISNKISNDRRSVIIYKKNNLTGQINSKAVPLDKFYNDITGFLGEKNAPKVQEAAREWLQKNTGSATPDLDKLHTIFAPGTPALQGQPVPLKTGSLDNL